MRDASGKMFFLLVFVAAALFMGIVIKNNLPRTYELITGDNITIVIEGRCDATQAYVMCNGEYYYDIKEFREIK